MVTLQKTGRTRYYWRPLYPFWTPSVTDPKDGTKEETPELSSGADAESSDQSKGQTVGETSGQDAASTDRSDGASSQWSRRGTLPRYQPPIDSDEVPVVSSSNLPRYQVPSDL